MSKKKEISRRSFLTKVAAGSAALTIGSRENVLGRGFTPPSDTLNIASVGIGGMGRTNLVTSPARTLSPSAMGLALR